jgi:hypothetical protein
MFLIAPRNVRGAMSYKRLVSRPIEVALHFGHDRHDGPYYRGLVAAFDPPVEFANGILVGDVVHFGT